MGIVRTASYLTDGWVSFERLLQRYRRCHPGVEVTRI